MLTRAREIEKRISVEIAASIMGLEEKESIYSGLIKSHEDMVLVLETLAQVPITIGSKEEESEARGHLTLGHHSFSISLSSLAGIIWFLIIVIALYWFYNAVKRLERSLEEIKRKLGVEGATQDVKGQSSGVPIVFVVIFGTAIVVAASLLGIVLDFSLNFGYWLVGVAIIVLLSYYALVRRKHVRMKERNPSVISGKP